MLAPVALHHPRRLPLELGDHGRPVGLADDLAAGRTTPTCWRARSSGARSATRRSRRSSPPCGVVALGLMAAFVLARYSFRGRGLIYAVFAAGLMFPMTVAITPLYIMVRNLGPDELARRASSCPQIAFAPADHDHHPACRSCGAIPNELQEAASIDGCSRLGFFWRMVIPLAIPGVITVGILAFIGSWNSYLLPLFILNNEASFTLPLGVAGVRVAVLRRHRQGARLHVAVDDPGAGVLQPLRATHRRRADRRGEGLSQRHGVTSNGFGARPRARSRQMTLEEKTAQLGGFWVDQGDELVAPMAGELASSTRYDDAIARTASATCTRVYGTRPVDPGRARRVAVGRAATPPHADPARHPRDRPRGMPDGPGGLEGGDLSHAARLGGVVRPRHWSRRWRD